MATRPTTWAAASASPSDRGGGFRLRAACASPRQPRAAQDTSSARRAFFARCVGQGSTPASLCWVGVGARSACLTARRVATGAARACSGDARDALFLHPTLVHRGYAAPWQHHASTVAAPWLLWRALTVLAWCSHGDSRVWWGGTKCRLGSAGMAGGRSARVRYIFAASCAHSVFFSYLCMAHPLLWGCHNELCNSMGEPQ